MSVKNIMAGIVLFLFIPGLTPADDTDRVTWRGPQGNGFYNSTAWSPDALQGGPRIVWKINVGRGFSAVAVRGDVFYTMGNNKNTDTVYCLNVKTGKTIWEYRYPCKPGEYNGPRATPVLDGNNLYTLSREGHIFCLNAENGKVIWQKHLVTDFGASPPTWSFASTPQIDGDVLFLNANQYGVALDKSSGKKIWSSPKGTGGYSTAVFYVQKKTKAVAFFGEKAIFGVDRETGKMLWEYNWKTRFDVNAADPVIEDNRVFFSSGYGKGCALLDISSNKVKKIWESTVMASHFSSFIYKDGYIYGSSGNAGDSNAGLVCLDMKTGKVQWEKRLGMGSLIASNGYLLYFSERGKLSIAALKADAYKEMVNAQILSVTCWTPPVLYIDKLFLRNDRGDLVCVDLAGKQS